MIRSLSWASTAYALGRFSHAVVENILCGLHRHGRVLRDLLRHLLRGLKEFLPAQKDLVELGYAFTDEHKPFTRTPLMISSILHLILHLAVPGFVAWRGFRDRWQRAWLIMICTMIVDLDHLLADPIFDPNRCSIGFHPLHTVFAILIYMGMAAAGPTRLIGLGLLIHMGLDGLDCIGIP